MHPGLATPAPNGPTAVPLDALLDAMPDGPPGPTARMQALRQRLQAQASPAAAPAALWVELAQTLQHGWLKGQQDPPVEAQRALSACLAWAWAGRPPSDWLAEPLLAARLQAEAALGETHTLARLVHDTAALLAQPAQQPQLRLVLRMIRRHKAGSLVAPLLPALAGPWLPTRPWRLELAQALALAAQQAVSPAELAGLAGWLPRLLRLLPPTLDGGPLV